MRLDQATGWLDGVRQVKTTHYNERPDQADISLIVLHNISLPPGEYGGPYIEQLFTGSLDAEAHPHFETLPKGRVSTHFFINRKGELTQFVSVYDRAWHAGVSSFEGRADCNDFSIGIELEGEDDSPYESAQYQKLSELTDLLFESFSALNKDRVVGHCDVSPGRKTDPGASFDWELFHNLLGEKV